jgi:hypothetical protein
MGVKLYTCTSFKGRNPVGTAAIIAARDKGHAKRLLTAELTRLGLPQTEPLEVEEFTMTASRAVVLLDGEY